MAASPRAHTTADFDFACQRAAGPSIHQGSLTEASFETCTAAAPKLKPAEDLSMGKVIKSVAAQKFWIRKR